MIGRGAQSQLNNPFDANVKIQLPLIMDMLDTEELKTSYQLHEAKSIVNEVKSPDLKFDYSINPYQGCEHGCSYCYARPTHAYWGFNAGLDFEAKIIAKKNAPDLLRAHLKKASWQGKPIMFSGNTDCYQPLERKLRLTRQLLEICLEHRQPIALITKNDLILRDIDLLEEMASLNLVQVAISITTINEALRREMEPRTSTAYNRFETVKKLSSRGVPVAVMMAPVIPGLNDHEMIQIAANASKMGARAFHYTLIRLNGDVEQVFTEWLEAKFPKRKDRVLSLIRSCRGGALGEHRFHERMKGRGGYADSIQEQFRLCKLRYFSNKPKMPHLNQELFIKNKFKQLSLFDTWEAESA